MPDGPYGHLFGTAKDGSDAKDFGSHPHYHFTIDGGSGLKDVAINAASYKGRGDEKYLHVFYRSEVTLDAITQEHAELGNFIANNLVGATPSYDYSETPSPVLSYTGVGLTEDDFNLVVPPYCEGDALCESAQTIDTMFTSIWNDAKSCEDWDCWRFYFFGMTYSGHDGIHDIHRLVGKVGDGGMFVHDMKKDIWYVFFSHFRGEF